MARMKIRITSDGKKGTDIGKKCLEIFDANLEKTTKYKKFHKRLKNEIIKLCINPRMRTNGGTANGKEFKININYRLFKENPDKLKQTFLHELAHIIQRTEHGYEVKSHGEEWKEIMLSLGRNPARCHEMDTAKLKRRHKRYTLNCECKEWNLTKKWAVMAKGKNKPLCNMPNGCKKQLFFKGEI